jgi:hypothetical protein
MTNFESLEARCSENGLPIFADSSPACSVLPLLMRAFRHLSKDLTRRVMCGGAESAKVTLRQGIFSSLSLCAVHKNAAKAVSKSLQLVTSDQSHWFTAKASLSTYVYTPIKILNYFSMFASRTGTSRTVYNHSQMIKR